MKRQYEVHALGLVMLYGLDDPGILNRLGAGKSLYQDDVGMTNWQRIYMMCIINDMERTPDEGNS